MQRNHLYSVFFAPRGRNRIFDLGIQIAQMYLSPFDKIIGIVGEAGSGKSALIKGMFPGLELTNDDDGVNIRPLPLLELDRQSGFFSPHTYHVDIRFELAFSQPHELATAIREAISRQRRVIVEHFDLIYPFLGMNAQLLIGVGEEILITRPNIFGPEPKEIRRIVFESLPYRLMAHTAEDLCEFYLPPKDMARCQHSDIKHGFVLTFDEHTPDVDLFELEQKVLAAIAADYSVSYQDEEHIAINGTPHACTGPRTHVPHTGMIEHFRLLHKFLYNPLDKQYLLVGRVGESSDEKMSQFNDLDLK
ncbi:MAG: alanine-tRNA synthetase second additional domain-containing protein [Clostridia bacterium]